MINPSLNQLTFDKKVVLERLRENRSIHRQTFEEALEGYERRMVQELQRRIRDVRKGVPIEQYIGLETPADHTKDYDTIIEMLELTNDDTVVLTVPEFRQYMQDEWTWKTDFVNTASGYGSATAARLARRAPGPSGQ